MAENTVKPLTRGIAMNTQETLQKGTVIYPEMDIRIREGKEKEHRNRRIKRKVLVGLAWTAVILVVAFLILFISTKVGKFESISDMLYYISLHFEYANLFKVSGS